MKIEIELTEQDLQALVLTHIREKLGAVGDDLTIKDVKIEVKTKENYRATQWEAGAYRARVSKQ